MTDALITTPYGPIHAESADHTPVYRVGHAPNPWIWTPWEYATNGVFGGRWDDPSGTWRSLYLADTLLGCYLEVLAPFRPDLGLAAALEGIEEDPDDAANYPTIVPGTLSTRWCRGRMAGAAHLAGWYANPSTSTSLPTIRAALGQLAATLGIPDIDAAAMKNTAPRQFTQHVAAWLYDQRTPAGGAIDGIRFTSRHGDDIGLRVIFERDSTTDIAPQLFIVSAERIDPHDPVLNDAMRIHRLTWSS